MNRLTKIVARISSVTGLISGVFVVLVMLIVVANVIARRAFATPIFGATEIAKYGMMVAASLALVNNEWHDGNVQMTVILEQMKGKTRNIFNVIMNFVGFAGVSYVTYFMAMQTAYKAGTGEVSLDLMLPVWFFVAILTAGTALLALCLLGKAIIYCRAAATGEPVNFYHDKIDRQA